MQGIAAWGQRGKMQNSVTTDSWTSQRARDDLWVWFDPFELKEGSV